MLVLPMVSAESKTIVAKSEEVKIVLSAAKSDRMYRNFERKPKKERDTSPFWMNAEEVDETKKMVYGPYEMSIAIKGPLTFF